MSLHLRFYYTCAVKRYAIIFLSAVFLSGSTELHELLKVPMLVTHFLEHKSENPQMTFMDFISLHYIQQPVNDKDYQRDNQLPFKNVEHLTSSITAFIPNYFVKLQALQQDTALELSGFRTSFISFQLLSNIWQPPKC